MEPRALRVGRGLGIGTRRWTKITGNFSTRLLLSPFFVWPLCLNANGSLRTSLRVSLFGGGKKRDDEKSKDYCKADTT